MVSCSSSFHLIFIIIQSLLLHTQSRTINFQDAQPSKVLCSWQYVGPPLHLDPPHLCIFVSIFEKVERNLL